MKDKDVEAVADVLASFDADVTVVELAGDRALDPDTLTQLLKQRGVRVDNSSSVTHAVDRFRRHAGAHDVLLLTGSHLVVSAALVADRQRD
jgi:folylpolyglutamate synthase/dihydropteroate synthase